MDRQKLVDVIASAPSGGPSGTVGGATAEQVLLALEHAGYSIGGNPPETPVERPPTWPATDTSGLEAMRPKPGDG